VSFRDDGYAAVDWAANYLERLRELRGAGPIRTIWRSGERLLVAVGPSPFSTQLVRWTRRMAAAQGASWIAVSVESSRTLEAEAQRQDLRPIDILDVVGQLTPVAIEFDAVAEGVFRRRVLLDHPGAEFGQALVHLGATLFHLVMDVIDRVPSLRERAAGLRQQMQDARLHARAYTREFGEDPPEVRDWTWTGAPPPPTPEVS